MGARSTKITAQNNRSDGHLLSYFRNTFIRGAGAAIFGPIIATGGTKTTVGAYTVHTFTTTGPSTFTISSGVGLVEYLVVAGGGGGYDCIGNQNAGGGGAGGLLSNHPAIPAPLRGFPSYFTPGSYPVIVGTGGGGGNYPGGVSSRGGNSNFSSIIASGGGSNDFSPGGSGSGGFAGPTVGGTGNTPPTSPPQGNPGGDGNPYSNSLGSGGGGAGGAGNPAAGPGLGGAGIAIDFPGGGSPTTYAQGGNGSGRAASPTTANSGNGGYSTYSGGSPTIIVPGAPGIVIIRYLT